MLQVIKQGEGAFVFLPEKEAAFLKMVLFYWMLNQTGGTVQLPVPSGTTGDFNLETASELYRGIA